MTEEHEIDFSGVDEAQGFQPVPPGTYLSRCVDASAPGTNDGRPMFNLKFKVVEGECSGHIFFDNVTIDKHNEKTMSRLKLVCHRLARMDVSGRATINELCFLGKVSLVTIEVDSYTPDGGAERQKNKVAFDGYETPDKATIRKHEATPLGAAAGGADPFAAPAPAAAATKKEDVPF